MKNDNLLSGLDAFHLSRVNAYAEYQGYLLRAERAYPTGHGVHLTAAGNDGVFHFWTPEDAWCAWLEPQLAVTSLADIDSELLPALASWTLAPLDDWQQQQGCLAWLSATAESAAAPPARWCLTLCSAGRSLPIYLSSTPTNWLYNMLASLQPSPQQEHELELALGWCLLEMDAWQQLAVGDALPIIGMAETTDTFWVHPSAHLGHIRLLDTSLALIEAENPPLLDAPEGTLRLTVNAGNAHLSAQTLASWHPGQEVPLRACAYPALQLCANGKLLAQGQLLRLGQSWAVRILACVAVGGLCSGEGGSGNSDYIITS